MPPRIKRIAVRVRLKRETPVFTYYPARFRVQMQHGVSRKVRDFFSRGMQKILMFGFVKVKLHEKSRVMGTRTLSNIKKGSILMI